MKKIITGFVVVLMLVGFQLAPVYAGFAEDLKGSLVSLQGKDFKSFDSAKLKNVKYIAVYFSAHWCPPCRKFTPKLVEYYNQAKGKNPNFEVIFVSSDRSRNDMKKYMEETGMKWPAVSYDLGRSGKHALKKYARSGIPNLVFLDKSGKVLSASYDGSRFIGPYKVLDDIRKKLK